MGTQTIEELEIIIKAKIDDAIKGISTLTDTIKQKVTESAEPIKKLKNETQQIANTSNESSNRAINSFNKYQNTIKKTTAQQELLLKKIQDIQATLNMKDISKEFGKQGVLEMNAELEKLTNQYNKLNKEQEKSKNVAYKVSKEGQKSYESLWKAIKKGTIMVLGVQSAFSFLRQGMQSAINVNEDLQAQQSVTQNAIGQMFIPIMKKAYNIVQYLVIGLARLIEMFTGVNILSRVTTKNINNTSKSVKSLNKQLTGIDDIDVLSTSSGYLADGLSSDLKALQDFQDKIDKVNEIFDKWKIPEKIEKIKDSWNKYIQPIFNWMKDHPELLETFFGIFLTGKLLNSINKIMGSASAGTGLLGMNALLLGLAGALFTFTVVGMYKDVKEIREQSNYVFSDDGRKNVTNFTNQIIEDVDTTIKDGTMKEKGQELYQQLYDGFTTNYANLNGTMEKATSVASFIFDNSGVRKATKEVKYISDRFKTLVKSTEDYLDNTELTVDEYKEMKRLITDQVNQLDNASYQFLEGTDERKALNSAIDEGIKLQDKLSKKIVEVGSLEDKILYKKQQQITALMSGNITLANKLQKEIDYMKEYGVEKTNEIFNKVDARANSVFEKIKTKANEILNREYTPIVNVEGIKEKFNNVTTKLKTQLDNILSKNEYTPNVNVENVKSKFSNAITTIKEKLSGVFDKSSYNVKLNADTSSLETNATNVLKNVTNKINSVFGVFKTVNGSSNIGSIASKINSWYSSTKNILAFANGNVATSPTLGVFGEYANAKSNPEITAPQSILKQTFREELNNNSVNGGVERLTINLGTKTLFDDFIEYVNNLYANGVQVFKED